MSTGIKGSGEEILEQHPKLDKLVEILEEITGHWNGEDDTYLDGDGEIRSEESAHAADEAITKIAELKVLLEELNLTY